MIAWLSEPDDRESVDAIVRYIHRADMWSEDEVRDPATQLFGKVRAIQYLGLFKEQKATEILRNTLSESGARELLGEWVDLQQTELPSRFIPLTIQDAQGYAARGLILSRDPENIALVREHYERYAHSTQEMGYREVEMTEALMNKVLVGQSFAEALAHNDILQKIGVHEYLDTIELEVGMNLLFDHYEKYSGVDIGVGSRRLVHDPCPICGRTATDSVYVE